MNIRKSEVDVLNRIKRKCNLFMGAVVLSFGAGIFMTYFLPLHILVIIEAAVIVSAGLLFIVGK